MRATVMYGAGDVRVEDVPDAELIEPTDALVRVTPRRDLRQRPLAVQVDGTATLGPQDGARVHRRRRGRRLRRRDRQGRRPRRRPVSLVRRNLRLLPRGTAERLSARRQVWRHDVDGGQGEAVRVPQADGTLVVLPVAADDALMPSLLTLVRRDGHRPPRRARGEGRTRQDRGRCRRRRGRALRRHRREAARRRTDHPARPPPRPHRARPASSAPPTSSASAATKPSSVSAS